MPEQNVARPSSEKIEIRPEELPTTLEIARQGAKDYKNLFNSIKDKDLRSEVLSDIEIKGVFTGVSPEIGFSKHLFQFLTNDKLDVLKEVFENVDGNRYLLLIKKKESDRSVSLFNLKAVERVMHIHKNIFTFSGNKKEVLESRFNMWGDNRDFVRIGLLSGYPIEDVELYPIYLDISRTLDENLIGDDFEFAQEYKVNKKRTQEDRVRMAGLIYKSFDYIEGNDIETYLKQIRCEYKPLAGFIGFNREKDEAYVAALNKIYDESGIEEAAKSLQTDTPNM